MMQQVTPAVTTRTTHWPADSDAGLQIADYCSWAMQRKWEGGDTRSYALIQGKVKSEFDIFRRDFQPPDFGHGIGRIYIAG